MKLEDAIKVIKDMGTPLLRYPTKSQPNGAFIGETISTIRGIRYRQTLRSFLAWFFGVAIPFVAICANHREFSNWYVMGAMTAAFWGGMLAESPRVKEMVRTVTRYIVTVIEVRRG